uniref:Uncharacterized protein n=1 Tax=Arundo donax TaxID=35708 RepID=A0A0A9E484_ARUDO
MLHIANDINFCQEFSDALPGFSRKDFYCNLLPVSNCSLIYCPKATSANFVGAIEVVCCRSQLTIGEEPYVLLSINTVYGMRIWVLLFVGFWKATPIHILTCYGRLVKFNMQHGNFQDAL